MVKDAKHHKNGQTHGPKGEHIEHRKPSSIEKQLESPAKMHVGTTWMNILDGWITVEGWYMVYLNSVLGIYCYFYPT